MGSHRRDRDHYLGVMEQRAFTRLTGVSWQVRTFRRLLEKGRAREQAITGMTGRYLEGCASELVRTWPVG